MINWLQDLFPEVASRLQIAAPPRWLERILRGLRDRSLRSATANVVLGQRMRECVASFGVAPAKIRIIENWSDAHAGVPAAAGQTELRRQLALGNVRVVGYSGNLGRAHEFGTILEAATLLADDADVIFLMIGGGAGMSALRVEVEKRRLRNFRFLPYQPREALADSLAAIDLHLVSLLPSLEGLIVPSKIYGILAAGRPSIFIGDLAGEVAQLLAQFECGVTVRCGEGAALAAAILGLLRDDGARLEMGDRARAAFDERGSVARAERQWLDLLEEVQAASGAAQLSQERSATAAVAPR